MEYKLIFDKKFTRKLRKLDNSIQSEAEKKIIKLKENPQEGKPLKFFPNLFELHIRMFRIFYIVQEKEIRLLFIGLEHKDECDKYLRDLTSERIKRLIEENS